MGLFKKAAIIGTGLIGGSMALALKKKKLADEVIGVSRHQKNILLAKKRGAIDKGSRHISIVKGVDLLIFATPVKTIINLAPLISSIISKDCIVTDVGSTKSEIVERLEKIFPDFVGSHPLAGSEKRSMLNAKADMFEGTRCIITPTKKTSVIALNKIKALWKELGADVTLLTPKAHDKVLSFTSHLPHAAAFSLIASVPKQYLRFASSGLTDTTRIAASDPELWVDIFLSNRNNLIRNIGLLEHKLNEVKSALRKKDRDFLAMVLRKAKKKRDSLG